VPHLEQLAKIRWKGAGYVERWVWRVAAGQVRFGGNEGTDGAGGGVVEEAGGDAEAVERNPSPYLVAYTALGIEHLGRTLVGNRDKGSPEEHSNTLAAANQI
jgi:hypothetical protein